MIDDSALFHGTYDPAKAREYYLRTRKLKGRKPGTIKAPDPSTTGRRPAPATTFAPGKPNRSNTKSRRAELEAQKVALEKRLDRLKEVLRKLVEEAKSRSGADKPESDSKDKAPETQTDKADRNADEKSKKLTSKQKSEKAEAAKEAYEKENPNSLSQDVEVLALQVKDIQAKIQKAVADARERKQKADKNNQTLVRPPSQTFTSGPQGR